MREIKFRVHDGKKYHYPECDEHKTNHYLQFGNNGIFYLHDADGNYVIGSKDGGIIGQFTGLKDKNGVDIYEGDIVKILYTDWPSKLQSDHRTLQQYLNDISYIAKVVFERNSWRVSIYGKKYQEWYFDDITPGQHGFIEVIGNVHENPELLDPR